MPEQSNPQNLHPLGAEVYPDEQVVELLADPEIKEGLEQSKAAIAEHYQSLQATSVAEGVTPTGDCVHVAAYSNPEDEHAAKKYVAFAYPLSSVATPGFAPAPRSVGYATEHIGGGIGLDVAKPGESITVTHADVANAVAAGLKQSKPDEFRALAKASRDQAEAADKLHLPQVSSDAASFNKQPIATFEDAAFGSRRQAVVDETIAPLVAQFKEHIQNSAKAIGDSVTQAGEDALSRELSDRIREIVSEMRSNPAMIDEAGPALAEYVAQKVNGVKAERAGKLVVQAVTADAGSLSGAPRKRRFGFGSR